MLIAGRYRPHTALGRGAMGEVWRARDEVLGTDVAIKFLLSQSSDATATARFRLEAQTAGRLDHPHVVGVLDFGAHEDRLFLVMELVEGDSLARVLSTAGSLPPERVARIAAEAAAGLAAAHEQGIVHRDIKPGNLLLAADGSLKIGDFGIARFMDDPAAGLTATGQIVGTSLYLAPERALGRPAGPPSDVYSLGCVLYQLLIGRPPFEADTAVAILHHHLDTAPTPPRQFGVDMPPALENYLLGMLAKQPEARPTAPQVAEWFAVDSWRGHREPLPPATPRETGGHASRRGRAAPGSGSGPTATAGPRSRPAAAAGRTAPGPAGRKSSGAAGRKGAGAVGRAGAGGAAQARHLSGEPGPATTYALPSGTHASSPHRGRGRRRPALRHLAARSPKLVGTIAAAVLFVAALLIGMALFSPDSGAAETSGPDTPRSSAPAPLSGTDTAPADPGFSADSVSAGSADGDGTPDGQPEKKPEHKDGKKKHDDHDDKDDKSDKDDKDED
ncbi:serine/threonine-protein kinase [Streptomyces shenzhenensis]|uniref:non-specific serine/threonine protein kinase n=1 Tax=Streptomyces shenzhenensis TaxID=943815 RepID=A0A3M0I7P6_9ACTN|nr:serine/threonine protein kinase [Streptomyces shenzhenensis]